MQNQSIAVSSAAANSSSTDLPDSVMSSEITSFFRIFIRSCDNLTLPSPDAFVLDSGSGATEEFKELGASSGGGPVIFIKTSLRCGHVQLAPVVATPAVPFSRAPVWGVWIVMSASVCDLPPGCMVHCEVMAKWPDKGSGEVSLGGGRVPVFAPYFMQQGNLEVAINNGPMLAAAAAAAAAAMVVCVHVSMPQFNVSVLHAGAAQGIMNVCESHDSITRFKEGRSQLLHQQQQDMQHQQLLSSLGCLYRHSPTLHPPPPPTSHEWLYLLNLVESVVSQSPVTPDDRSCIWRQRRSMLSVSHALAAVVQSTPWLSPSDVADIHSLLPQWSPMRECLLLQLLQARIQALPQTFFI